MVRTFQNLILVFAFAPTAKSVAVVVSCRLALLPVIVVIGCSPAIERLELLLEIVVIAVSITWERFARWGS